MAYILQKRNKTGSNKEFSRIFSFRKKGVNPIDVTFFGDDYNFDQVQKKNSEDSNIENSGWNASSNSKRHSRDKFLNTPCFIPRVIHSIFISRSKIDSIEYESLSTRTLVSEGETEHTGPDTGRGLD